MQYGIDSDPVLQAKALGYLLPFFAFGVFCILIFAGLLYFGFRENRS